MAVNLIRNSRVFFTTNVDSQGRVRLGAYKDAGQLFDVSDTFEIQVLEGLSFTQNTATDTVTLNEAGPIPARGQRSFNTALEPLDFSFATYLRPDHNGGTVTCEEKLLWNALATNGAIGGGSAAWTNGTGGSAGTLTLTNSNKHQLQAFGLIIMFDDLAYVLDNCALDSVTIDFGIDAIASAQWSGKGGLIRQINVTADQSSPVKLNGTDVAGAVDANLALAKNPNAKYITNKLTNLVVNNTINDFVGSDYAVPITGGSITFSNNITYLTPQNLGVVNLPITYFTGTRSITGTLNAYLRSGSANTGGLLNELLANAANEIDPDMALNIQLGGTTGTHVDIKIPAAMLQIPTVNTDQVISTTITFTGQGYTGTAFNIDEANELTIEYHATA